MRNGHLNTSFAAILAVLVFPFSCVAQEKADHIWTGGTIITMNDDALRAEAVAEKDGKVLAVGSKADVMKLKGDATKVLDLRGRTMLPGFFDAHGHMFIGGLQALSANLLAPPDGTVTDIASLQQVIRDWVAANKGAIEKFGLIMGSDTTTRRWPSIATRRVRTSTRSAPSIPSTWFISRGIWGPRTRRRLNSSATPKTPRILLLEHKAGLW